MSTKLLRALVDLRNQQVQRARIQFGNRISALDRGDDEGGGSGQRALAEKWFEHFQELEKELDKDITAVVTELPFYEQISAVRGIGPLFAAQVMALIDIEKPQTVSALWRYAGYGLGDYWADESGKIVAPKTGYQSQVNGNGEKQRVRVVADPEPDWTLVRVRDRNIKGWCSCYNKRLKVILYNVAGSFMKAGGPYKDEYDRARDWYEHKHPEWNGMRKHRAAKRKMIKLFLSHLWERWRKFEGLPTREVYVKEVLGHTSISSPEDYGWPEWEQP